MPYALIFGGLRILLDLVPKLALVGAKLYYSTFFIAFILEVLALIFLIKKYRSRNHNALEIREALVIGVMFMVVVGSLYAVQSYLFDSYINPDFQKNTALEWANLYGKGVEVEELIAENSQQTSSVFSIFSSILKFSLLGILISFVVGSIFKRR